MSAAAANSRQAERDLANLRALSRIRAHAEVGLGVKLRAGRSVLDKLHQSGGAKARFPKRADRAAVEAVLINTAGGMAGGDRWSIQADVAAGAHAVMTTPAAERIYRAIDGETTRMSIALTVGAGAQLDWLVQETIVFDRAALARSIDVAMAPDAKLTLSEILVFGRAAMGETLSRGAVRDRWRIRRDGRLVHAEDVRFGDQGHGGLDGLQRTAAVLGEARCSAGLVHVARDAEDKIETVRQAIAPFADYVAASAWDGRLVVRTVAPDLQLARAVCSRVIPVLTERELPRVWGN